MSNENTTLASSSVPAVSDGISISEETSIIEEEEPLLKYQRITSPAISALLQRDSFACICASPKFTALGTHWGVLILIDVLGNEIKSWVTHQASINALSLDSKSEYVASASDDGSSYCSLNR